MASRESPLTDMYTMSPSLQTLHHVSLLQQLCMLVGGSAIHDMDVMAGSNLPVKLHSVPAPIDGSTSHYRPAK